MPTIKTLIGEFVHEEAFKECFSKNIFHVQQMQASAARKIREMHMDSKINNTIECIDLKT